MEKYSRLLVVVALTFIVGLFVVTNNNQTDDTVLMGDPVAGVAGTSADDELSVGYSQPGTLEAGGSDTGGTPANVQDSASLDSTQTVAPDSSASAINSSSTSSNSVPMPDDFQYSMPGSSNVDMSTAHCVNCQ